MYLIVLFHLFFACCPLEAAVKVISIVSEKTTISKGQTGIVVEMEAENLDSLNPVNVTVATLTYTLGQFETTLNSPTLPAVIPAAGKITFKFTLSVFPLSDSGVCTVDGQISTSGGNDNSADLTHKFTIQQPAEVVVTSILGAAEVTRGSSGNQAIMDVGRSGEADILINSADLAPVVPGNYAGWQKISPEFPQNFAKVYWWDQRWFYRKQISITNRSSSVLPDTYEIKLIFDHQKLVAEGKSLASGDDVRIVYFDGVSFTEIERYLDPLASSWNQSNTTIWFRLQAPILSAPASSDKYAIYYGTDAITAANPPDNPANVFTFFDDFESGANGWTNGRFPTYVWNYGDRWERGTAANGDSLDDDDRRGPTGPRSGNNYWATDLDNTYDNSGRATTEIISLRSPDIDLVDKLNPTLTFWDFYDIENGGAYDFGVLRICQGPVPAQSDPMQPNGTQLQLLESAYLNQHGPWQQQSYSLAPSVGKTAYIEFTFGSDWAVNSYGWAIDDVLIRQIAVPEPDNPLLGVEEQVPLTPTIKVYFEVDVADTAVEGDDIVDGVAYGTEGNTQQTISDNHATLPLEWYIRGQDFKIYSNAFYASPKDTFNTGETVYGKGTGYEPNVPCLIKWFDPSLNVILSSVIYPDPSGNIYCSRIMQGSDTTGKWKITITNVSESKVFAETTFNLNSPAQLVSEIILPDHVISGQEFQIIHRVNNAGQTRAIGVSSSALTSIGGGSVTSLDGPVPSSISVAGGGSAEFVWTAVAGNQGQLSYRANSTGTVEGTSNSVSSVAVTSNVCKILQENISINLVEADDDSVTRGQSSITERVTIANNGTADLTLNSINLIFQQGATDHSDKYTTSLVQPEIPATVKGNPFPSWWNTNYAYRQPLRILGDARSYPAGCSARITVDTSQYVSAGQMQADADDWRIVFWNDAAGTWTELDRDYVSNEITWFKLQRELPPYGCDEGYFVYYGNPAATNPPENLNNVYLFFENWETPVRANGFTRRNANVDINGDGEWVVGTNTQDGVYILRNSSDGATPLYRNNQAICLKRLDFGNATPFAEFIRNLDTQTYPQIKLSWWRYYDDNCDWDGGTSLDWAEVVYWDGTAEQSVIYYPGNGPDDSVWHYEEYDLSGFNTSPNARLHFRGNFWYLGWDDNDRIVFDDIKAIMAAPDCIGLAEESQPETELVATYSIGVLPTAPTGVYTLDASAEFTSLIGTGTYSDSDSAVTDTWTVISQTIETCSDAAMTVSADRFSQGSTVYAKFSGFTPGPATVRWYDGYPTGTNVFTDNPTVDAGGGFTLNQTIPAGADFGVWTIAVIQGAAQVATGSFRVMALPELGSKITLSPEETTVGVKFLATLEVTSCLSASDFNFATTGAPPTDWNVNQPARITVINDATYAANPVTNYLGMVTNAATTLTAEKVIRLKDCNSIKLSYDYSLVLAGAATLFIEYSTNGGTSWVLSMTHATSTGAGNWTTAVINFPDSIGNSEDFRVRFRFVTSGAGFDRAYIDNIFLSAACENFEKVDLTPRSWVADPSGSGDASIVGSPQPSVQTVSTGDTAVFTAEYMPLTQTTVGSKFYLHGAGTPALLAAGVSDLSSTQINASDTLSNGIEIFLEALSVAPAVVDLGTVDPGSESSPQTLTISNDGNFDLEFVRWEFYNLASDPYFIPNSAIEAIPENLGALAVGANTNADIKLTVPAGTVAGTYKANQFVFEDNNQDGNSIGEPIGQFKLRVTVPSVEKIRAATDSLFLGSFLAGETTSSASVIVTNIGNVNLSIVRFVPVNLTSGGNSIASAGFNLDPQARGFLVKGSSYLQTLSLSIPGGTPGGTYSGQCYFLDDKNANLQYEPGEASFPITISVEVGTSESLNLSSTNIILPDTLPGEIAVSPAITVTNTGNIPLNYLCFEPATLTVSGFDIGPEYITFAPDPVPAITPGNTDQFLIYVVMPPGQPNPGGRYVGTQRIYNDKNQNGAYDAGEANVTFELRIRPGNNRGFVISQDVANLGAGLPNDTISGNIDVLNIGNMECNRLKWLITSNLVSDGNTIPAGNLGYLPANGWSLAFNPGDSQTATVSLLIPPGQPAGTYIGECVLYRDANNNNVFDETGDASDTFLIQLEVGNEGVDILESSPFELGSAKPSQTTPAVVFSVKNIGERTLTNLKYDKPDLVSGALPIIPSSLQSYSTPDPIGLIAGGVTVGPSVYVNVPANCQQGIYTGTMRIYQDENDNGVWDGAAEVTDTIDYRLEVLSQAVIDADPAIFDLGAADKGQTITYNFNIENKGNVALNNIKYLVTDLVDGGNTIPVSSITVTPPETPWAIPNTGTTVESGSIAVQTSFTTPTSNYSGTITFWEDANDNDSIDAGETSDISEIRLSIGKKELTVLEDELNFGVVEKGNDSSHIGFNVRNVGTVPISNTKIAKSALLGPGTIPTTDLIFSSAVVTPPNLNPGVSREISLYVQTDAALPSGVYSGIQTIFEDVNNNNVLDVAFETYDTFNVIITITSGGVLSYELVANPGALTKTAGRGSTVELGFKLQSLCSNNMTNIVIQKADLASDATILPQANITFNPSSGIVLPAFALIDATATVIIPANLPAGHYVGYQHAVDLDHTIASTDILLDITVPKTILNMVPATLDMGNLPAGSTYLKQFEAQNNGMNDSQMLFTFSDFNGPGFTIPAASASVVIPSYDLFAGNTVLASVSILIDTNVPAGAYAGTLTLTDFNFPTETSAVMNITFVVESAASSIPDTIVQTVTNFTVANSVIPSEKYVFSAYTCATQTVNPAFEGIVRVREWRYNDPTTPLATHTIVITGTELNQSLNRWFRVSMPFTSDNSADLGSFTFEITIQNGSPGDTAIFDGFQLEKAVDIDGAGTLPTPWVEDKGVVSPMPEKGLEEQKPYFTW